MRLALELENVVRAYPSAGGRRRSTLALRGLSCQVAEGECVGLLGPNGAGKTTMLRCAAGLLRPDAGTVRWFGQTHPRRLPRGVALVTDAPAYYTFLTVREALEHYAALHDVPGRDRSTVVDRLLEAVQLGPHADKRIAELSRGMTQRLGIAQALAGRPRLLLLDETLGGLDPITRRTVRDLLRDVARGGSAIVLSTHDVSSLEQLADRVLVQHDGRIAAELDPRSLTYTRWLVLGLADTLGHLSALGRVRPAPGGVAVALDGRTPEEVLALARAAQLRVVSTHLEADDLEARYLDAVRRVAGETSDTPTALEAA